MVMTAVQPLGITIAPMGMLAKLDAAANLVRLRFSLFARLVLVATVPIIAANVWLEHSLEKVSGRGLDFARVSGLSVFGFGFGNGTRIDSVALFVVSTIPTALVGVWIGVAMRQLIDGSEPTVWSVIKASLRYLPRLLVVWFVGRLLLAVGLVACGFGALFVSPYLALAMPLLGFEGTTVRQTFSRSARLGRRGYGTVLMSIVLTGVGWLLVMGAMSLAFALVIGMFQLEDSRSLWIGWSVVNGLTRLATVPFAASVAFVTYVDLRCKIEGWDLAARASIAFGR